MAFYLHSFASHSFRNLEGSPLKLHERFNVFFGDNGQGKTNLLEAVYYLFTLRPLRSVRPAQLISWEESEALVQGEVFGQIRRKMAVRFTAKKRQISLNGAPPLRLDDYFDGTHVVVFLPEEIQLIRGAPELRRRFIDRAIFNTNIGYLNEMRQFLKILAHRKALFRQKNPDIALLDVLDTQFVRYASRIILRRLLLLKTLKPHLHRAFEMIFPRSEMEIDLLYHSSLPQLPQELDDSFDVLEAQIAHIFQSQLEKVRPKELERLKSLIGPHLDDIHFHYEGRPFKVSASQGQTRALVLALKIAEIHVIKELTGESPLLLLDDVAGELDPRRAEYFFQFLKEMKGQVLLTTTDLDYIKLPDLADYPRFHVFKGKIQQKTR